MWPSLQHMKQVLENIERKEKNAKYKKQFTFLTTAEVHDCERMAKVQRICKHGSVCSTECSYVQR